MQAGESFVLHVYRWALSDARWHVSPDGRSVIVIVPAAHFSNDYIAGRATTGSSRGTTGGGVFLWRDVADTQNPPVRLFAETDATRFLSSKVPLPLDAGWINSHVYLQSHLDRQAYVLQLHAASTGGVVFSHRTPVEQVVGWYPQQQFFVTTQLDRQCAPVGRKGAELCKGTLVLRYNALDLETK